MLSQLRILSRFKEQQCFTAHFPQCYAEHLDWQEVEFREETKNVFLLANMSYIVYGKVSISTEAN